MLISVVMPSLNSAEFLKQAIESVLSQTVDLELVIQDGGSTDETRQIVESFDDPRITLDARPDQGQADALNKALERVRGDWVLWLNADDELAPGVLRELTPRLGDHDLIYGDFVVIDEGGRALKVYETPCFSFERVLRRGAYIFSGSVLVRRDVLQRAGRFDEELHYCMDYDFLLRLAPIVSAFHWDGPVAFLREHGDSKSQATPWGFWRESWAVRRTYGMALPRRVVGQVAMGAYFLTRPLWRSTAWRSVRPKKHLG